MQVENGSERGKKHPTTIERRGDLEIVVTRIFDAPARILFDCWTKPELVLRWWAPRSSGMKLVACDIDLRPGGRYRYVFEGEGGKQMEFFGTYKEVERPTRLVSTDEEQAPAPGDVQPFTTTTFAEKGGQTTVTVVQRFATKEALEEMLGGMEAGTCEQYEQLDELLATSPAA